MIVGEVRIEFGRSLGIRLVRKCVERIPGASFTEIRDMTGLSTGSTHYAIRRLKILGMISEKVFWKNKRYFEPSIQDEEKKIICVLRNRSARRIINVLIDNGGVTSKEVHDALGISYPAVRWHLKRLCECRMLTKSTSGTYIIIDRGKIFEVLASRNIVNKISNNFGSMWEV